jgi:hypothetical protein
MATERTREAVPENWEESGWIVSVVRRGVELDLETVKADLLEKLEEPSDEYIWIRAERIAGDSIDTLWGPTLLEQCASGLAGARDVFLAMADRCSMAAEELQQQGLESWVVRAVRHELGVSACFDTLDERHGVTWWDCDDGRGE